MQRSKMFLLPTRKAIRGANNGTKTDSVFNFSNFPELTDSPTPDSLLYSNYLSSFSSLSTRSFAEVASSFQKRLNSVPAHPKGSDSPKSLYSQSLVPDERMNNFHHHKSPTTKIQPLRIFQWNCHSFSNKFEFFRKIIYNYDIGVLSETWLRP